MGTATGHLEAQITLQGWVAIGQSSAAEALRAVGGPKEALGIGECQEASLTLDLHQESDMASGRTLPSPVLLLPPQDTAVRSAAPAGLDVQPPSSSTQQGFPSMASAGPGPGHAVMDQIQELPGRGGGRC